MKKGLNSGWWKPADSHHQEDVSSTTVIKAYTLSCLLFSLLLLSSVGDAWCQYAQFCVATFSDRVADFMLLGFNL